VYGVINFWSTIRVNNWIYGGKMWLHPSVTYDNYVMFLRDDVNMLDLVKKCHLGNMLVIKCSKCFGNCCTVIIMKYNTI